MSPSISNNPYQEYPHHKLVAELVSEHARENATSIGPGLRKPEFYVR